MLSSPMDLKKVRDRIRNETGRMLKSTDSARKDIDIIFDAFLVVNGVNGYGNGGKSLGVKRNESFKKGIKNGQRIIGQRPWMRYRWKPRVNIVHMK